LYYNYRDVVLLNDFVKESEFKETYQEKIRRILNYAEATSCRRNILLSYFGEFSDTSCGNCDICESPPAFIDGKTIAQMALSGILRTKQQVGANMLINILRGAKTMDLFDRKYHELRTYGVGKDYSFADWQHYVNQLINLGLIEIAYDDFLKLRITEAGDEILRSDKVLELTAPTIRKESKKANSKKATNLNPDEQLMDALKAYRKEIAIKNKVPAYVIFHDATLKHIASVTPQTEAALLQIQGMGKVKIERFGAAILKIVSENSSKKGSKVSTTQQTLELYEKGISVEEISTERKLSPTTIFGHLCKLYEEGHPIDLNKYVTEYEVNQVKEARKKLRNTNQLRPIFDQLEGGVEFHKIALALTILSKYH
jgi:ATP-dependent DNA helicase RecQ